MKKPVTLQGTVTQSNESHRAEVVWPSPDRFLISLEDTSESLDTDNHISLKFDNGPTIMGMTIESLNSDSYRAYNDVIPVKLKDR